MTLKGKKTEGFFGWNNTLLSLSKISSTDRHETRYKLEIFILLNYTNMINFNEVDYQMYIV